MGIHKRRAAKYMLNMIKFDSNSTLIFFKTLNDSN